MNAKDLANLDAMYERIDNAPIPTANKIALKKLWWTVKRKVDNIEK